MRRPKGVRTTDGVTIKRKTERYGFRARQRYKKPFQRPFLPYLFPQEGKDMARGAADAASQTAPRLRRIRNTPPEAFRAIPAHTK